MYEFLSVAVIPNLYAEGTALTSGLTALAAICLALTVILSLAVVPLSFRDAGVGSTTDDGETGDVSDTDLRQAA